MRDRQWRRVQRERVIARTEKWLKSNDWCSFLNKEEFVKRVRKTAVTPHACSSHCCGNPRKWFGERTRQELKADIGKCEQVSEEVIGSKGHKNH